MTITTKFSVGDIIWYLSGNRVLSSKVEAIHIKVDEDNEVEVKYRTPVKTKYGEDILKSLRENEVFNSKEELINSL